MENNYLENQLLLRTEQETDFLKIMGIVRMEIIAAITGGKQEKLEQIIVQLTSNDFREYISGNLEISKMYLAAYYSDYLERVMAHGLPSSISLEIKKRAFHGLAASKNDREIEALTARFFRELFALYQRYGMAQYTFPVRRAMDMIHAMQMQPISAGKIAAALGMDRTYLSKRFRQETGRTMTDYIHQVKMDLAETMLAGRQYSLREIADLLGYESYAHFSRVFKKYKDVLPSQWGAYQDEGII